jgi:hypothetical protein
MLRRQATHPAEGPSRNESHPTASERAVAAVARVGQLLVRAVRAAASIVVAIIGLAILFALLDANTGNAIVGQVRDWAHTFAGPFRNMFQLHSAKGTLALNYGIAIAMSLRWPST